MSCEQSGVCVRERVYLRVMTRAHVNVVYANLCEYAAAIWAMKEGRIRIRVLIELNDMYTYVLADERGYMRVWWVYAARVISGSNTSKGHGQETKHDRY